ncbi:hypothetical protein R1sor_010107 [Riccia sorocarpa]|uniref:tRNA(Phe) (4-demethylwyosine(37)-C(7)) aminocarboxypropyltransferase n=1 Tax=Riccia sorocarpa TaxID=122646 RepID=A0ABD3HYI0_9MARC
MLKFLPEKVDKEAVLEEASSSDEESNKNKKKAKKKTVEVLPSQITTAIHRIYTAKHGIAAPSRQEPLHILHLSSVCQYKLTLNEQLNFSMEFTIVSMMEYGQHLVDFTSAIKEMKDAKVIFEVGCYEGVFAREALLSSRDVIYFASIQLEVEFMAKYSKLLQTHSTRVRDWFAKYKKKHGQVEVEDPPQAEQTGAVTVAALATPFVPDDSVMANAIERLGNITRVVHYAP